MRSNLCDCSDAYIHFKAIITVTNTAAAAASVNTTNKKVIFKKYALFTNCTSLINRSCSRYWYSNAYV